MGFCPQLGGVGPCPAQSVWQGSGFAADQTNAMLAVVRADDESLVPPQAAGLALSVARPLPTETASLGFGGSPVGGGNKNSCFAFFRHFYVGGVSLPSGRFVCVGTTRRGVYFSRKNGFLRVGALRRRTRCSLLHTVLFRRSCMGVVSLPSERSARSQTSPGRVSERQTLPLLGLGREVLSKNAESLRNSDALMRVAVPRRRGPAGLRDLFATW